MIRIGIEMGSKNLHCDLLENPDRYFFILVADARASLCIQTCDIQGEDIRTHIIDCLALNGNGNLYSIFEDDINDAVLEQQEWKRQSFQGYNYAISYAVSPQLVQLLSTMPDLMNWIVSSILNRGKNLILYPSEDIYPSEDR